MLGLVGVSGVSGCLYLGNHCWEEQTCDEPLPALPPPPPDPCDGELGAAPPLDECGVFVSASSGDDASPGTRGAPVRTLKHAIGLAAHGRGDGEPPTRRVYACGETFEEEITLPSGVDLWGARRCEDGGDGSYAWSVVGPHEPTTIAPPAGIPVRVLGGEDATSTIFGVHVVAADASARDGKSSIAMILSQGARAIVRESAIVASNGKDGEPGEDAPSERAKDGVAGNDGADACTADFAVGALPVVTVCDDGIESVGGSGGDGGLDSGRDGASGQPEPAENPEGHGHPGGGAGSLPCSPGEAGTKGVDRERAAGAAGTGYLGIDGWTGVRGEDGKRGGVGQGGGGGGGSKARGNMIACDVGRPQGGAAGGSGGSGGCGGTGGKGGGYGGTSIGIVALYGSAVTLVATEVTAGNGGNGGVGGRGQPGGYGRPGGHGGFSFVMGMWEACRGDWGGDGGRGGDAGGGLGGSSYGVASAGASVTFGPGATVHLGHAGDGGPGGNAAPGETGGKGGTGDSMPYRQFDVPDPGPPR
ncbi:MULTISPECIES: DUF1565 domain-containing protein [Sorangium]|uniref:PGRS family protein n=1 Tax=Sorangium cellulosum TaxID=56 RepID=A0A4P2QYS9_SORCE|nr:MULTISPECIES: DUF1565 domain-containing protein [Sorangium]AUX35446.1 hypothetical protein SOCE836_076380 [Sorangium cellulosum]WCQ94750.1 hypothetical protein NQZ70_07519 [Sorangium sp. Soce836]